jgi:translation initiation factor IF-2
MQASEERKKRVYELSRELNLSSEALLRVLTELNIEARSHMSTLTNEQAQLVQQKFEKEKQEARSKASRGRKRRKRKKKNLVTAEAVKTVKTTLASMDTKKARGQKKKRRKYREEKSERHEKQAATTVEDSGILRVTEFTSPHELAEMMGISASQVIAKCLGLGIMATVNKRLDIETISMIAAEFGREAEAVAEYGAEALETTRLLTSGEEVTRPPVVTIMGHVDHGKTALLDRIRSSNVLATEAGGITQHIGAYVSTLDDGNQITFIDTPGHAAFTAMRARGAQITDIVILVVAADSRVMPQTEEAIDHAKAATIPIIVAITKTDLAASNPDFIKQDLSQHKVLVEEWGGQVQCAEVSSITGEGIDDLLDKILLQAELLELTAVPDRPAKGTVLEGKIDPRRGSMVNILIQDGTLRENDYFVAGRFSGRIRAMFDENDSPLEEVPPGYPVQILGSSGVPEAGDSFVSAEDEQNARQVSLRRQLVERERELHSRGMITLEDFWKVSSGFESILHLVVKADMQGSAEAIVDTLSGMGSDEVSIDIIRSGAGGITESDVMLAAASEAVIIGFRVRPDARSREKATEMGVEISTFNVIYDIEDTVRKALSGLLKPEKKEEFTGSAEIRDTFRVPKIGIIAGCYVVAGKIRRNSRAKLVRDSIILWEGSLASLKHFKEDRKEIVAGFECGIGLTGFNDVKVGDIIECFEIIEIAREL